MKRYVAYLVVLTFFLSTQVKGQPFSCAYSSGETSSVSDTLKSGDDSSSLFSRIIADSISYARYPIYFQKNSMAIEKEFLDNGRQIESINQALLQSDEIDSITIYVYSSPEGPSTYNNSLAERRAVAARDFLVKNQPENSRKAFAQKIQLSPMGENWEGLRAELEANYHRQNRDEVLSILHSQANTELKKQQLQRLDNNITYSYIIKNHIPKLRVAFLVWARQSASEVSSVDSLNIEAAEPALTPDPQPSIQADLLADSLVSLPIDLQAELPNDSQDDLLTDSQVDSLTDLPVDSPTDLYADLQPRSQASGSRRGSNDEFDKKTILALKSNLLYDAFTLINGSVEVALGDKFSALAYSQFPWWRWGESNNETCIRFLSLGTEARWWFAPRPQPATAKRQERDRLVGHFAGVYAESGMWDFQFKRNMCRQGEFWSVGVSYGYAMPISRHLNLEFSLSVGYASIPYRGYTPSEDYVVLWMDKDNIGTWGYFGPTKAQVSLVVPIKAAYKKGGRR